MQVCCPTLLLKETDGYCITADYHVLTESSLGIVNAQVEGSPIGKISIVNGTATVLDPKYPGKLEVKLFVKSKSYSALPFL